MRLLKEAGGERATGLLLQSVRHEAGGEKAAGGMRESQLGLSRVSMRSSSSLTAARSANEQ